MRRTPGTWSRSADAPPLVRLAVAAIALALVLTGCELRLAEPDPPLLVPDAAEVLRERTAEQATELAETAEQAALTAAEPVADVLTRIAAMSREQAAAVGGLYEPFPGVTPEPSATPTATPAPPPPPDAAQVLDLLTEAAATARADAGTVPDGRVARLLASMATGRLLLADALTVTTGGTAGPVATVEVPSTLPAGMTEQDAVVLVQSEDAAGMVWEVAAARSADDVRQRAADRAALHRQRAQAWAEAAGVAGSGIDPRRSAYDLPDALTAEGGEPTELWAAVAGVEADLAVAYASLVAVAFADARDDLMDASLECTQTQVAIGMAATTFPGMPELG